MNKREAMEFLGISERTLQNLMTQGKLSFRMEPGKTGKVAVFDQAELERYKAERDKPVHRPAVQRIADDGGVQRGAESGGAEVQALAVLPGPEQIKAMSQLWQAMTAQQQPARAAVDIADKLLLTLAECQQLTGLSRATLRAAIDEGKLKAQQIGRGWKVKRSDLDSYIARL